MNEISEQRFIFEYLVLKTYIIKNKISSKSSSRQYFNPKNMQTNFISHSSLYAEKKPNCLNSTKQDSLLSNTSETIETVKNCEVISNEKKDPCLLSDLLEDNKIALIQEAQMKCSKKQQKPVIVESRTIMMFQGPPKPQVDQIIKTKSALCFVLAKIVQQEVREYLREKCLGDCYKLLVTSNIFTHKQMSLIQLNSSMKLEKFIKVCQQMIAHYSRFRDGIQFHQISQRMMFKNEHELMFASCIIHGLGQTVTTVKNNLMFPNLIAAGSSILLLKRLEYDIVPNPLNPDNLPQRAKVTEILKSLNEQNRLQSFQFGEIKQFISSENFNELNSVQSFISIRLTEKVKMIKMGFKHNLTIAQEWLQHQTVGI